MHRIGLEFKRRLSISIGSEASFTEPSSRWPMAICKQHNPNPINPKNSAKIIKRILNLAPVQSKAAIPPKRSERLKEDEISFLTNTVRV